MLSAELDAVTVDAFGTLVVLDEPAEHLQAVLAEHGVERDSEAIAAAFAVEARYYRRRSSAGRDERSLAQLHRDCAGIFLEQLEAELDPEAFAPAFVKSLVFRVTDGSLAALNDLRAAGLALACVANWDITLPQHLARLGLADRFATVVTSAEAGAEKPDPALFRQALERIRVPAERALHVGDEAVDRDGAHAAGLAFEPAPLATLPERLGLRRTRSLP